MQAEHAKLMKNAGQFLIAFAITFLLYFLLANAFPSNTVSTAWEKGCFDIKDRAAEVRGQKIIIVGGSNVLFGVSAKQIEEGTGMPSVNYGVHAGLRDYMFEKTTRIAKPGDIVVMALEYEYYSYDKPAMFETRTAKTQYVLAYDLPYFDSLPPPERFTLLCQNGVDLAKNIYFSLLYKNFRIEPGASYSLNEIDEWGDQKSYDKPNAASAMELVGIPEDFWGRFPDYQGPSDILAFARWCRENNVTLLASFPSVAYRPEYGLASYKQSFDRVADFYGSNGVEMMGAPEDFFYGPEYLYDTSYHLNSEGRKKRTDFIIAGLKEYLGGMQTAKQAGER